MINRKYSYSIVSIFKRYWQADIHSKLSKTNESPFKTKQIDQNSTKNFNEIPGSYKYPLIGNFNELQPHLYNNIHKQQENLYSNYGPIVRNKQFNENEIVLFDPNEFKKVVQAEGMYPISATSRGVWAYELQEKRNPGRKVTGIAFDGKRWKESRMRIQKDLFANKVAQTYMIFLNESASQSMDNFNSFQFKENEQIDIQEFLKYSISDMFLNAFLGNKNNQCNPTTRSAEEQILVNDTINFVKISIRLITSSYLKVFGPYSKIYKDYETTNNRMSNKQASIARDNYQIWKNKMDSMTEEERLEINTPYVYRLLSNCQNEELFEESLNDIQTLMTAGLDTTMYFTLWNMQALANHPEVQYKLRKEIQEYLGPDGEYTSEKGNKMEQLKNFIREVHRVYPINNIASLKTVSKEIKLCGYTIPEGQNVIFCNTLQRDPHFVDNCNIFDPERWSAEAVEKRKGTEKVILDNVILGHPFSFGARQCPGSRLAILENLSLLCKIVAKQEFIPEFTNKNASWDAVISSGLIANPYPKMKFKMLN